MVTRDTIKISLIPIFYGLNWFVSRYIIFTLFIPFINSFLTSLSKYRYLSFLLILFTVYAVLPVIGMNNFINGNRMMFFLVVYSIGGYLRLHCQDKIKSIYHTKYRNILIAATIMFLTFATMKMRYNKYINMLAETVLGVYLMITNFSRRRLYGIIYSQI